jgi:hypothetical protein
MSLAMFFGGVVGFALGCIVSIVVAMVLFNKFQKKQEQKAENRHSIVNTIGKACADVENAFSSYRMGNLVSEKLREIISSKIESITTQINSNVDILDAYYVKHIERFMQDQKAFLKEEGKSSETSPEGMRGISRGPFFGFEEPTFKLFSETGVSLKESLQEPAAKEFSGKTDMKTFETGPEVSTKFETGRTSKIPVEEVKAYKEPEPVKEDLFSFKPSTLETITFETKEFEPKSIFQPETTFKPEPSKVEEEFDIEPAKKREPVMPPPAPPRKKGKEKEPVKGTPVFEPSFDASSTQEFSLKDLSGKIKAGKSSPVPKETSQPYPVTEQKPKVQKDEEEEVFEVNIPKMHGSAAQADTEEESLITGNEVIDKIDSFFGFKHKK